MICPDCRGLTDERGRCWDCEPRPLWEKYTLKAVSWLLCIPLALFMSVCFLIVFLKHSYVGLKRRELHWLCLWLPLYFLAAGAMIYWLLNLGRVLDWIVGLT